MVDRIQIADDVEEIRSRLYRQEATARDVDAVRAFEVFDGSTNGSFQLDNLFARFVGLLVDDNLHF